MSRAQSRMLPDGRRLHLQDGPIDLVIEAFGPDEAVTAAYRAAVAAFEDLLDALCAELPLLRTGVMPSVQGAIILPLPGEGGEAEGRDGWGSTAPSIEPHPSPLRGDTFPWQGKEEVPFSASLKPGGPVARRMVRAVAPFAAETFVTPMAAVAGAVADHVLAAMTAAAPLARAYVNNGGDIALHVAPGERLRIGLVDRPDRPSLLGHVAIAGGDGIGGVATSGWRGRSFSLGIADAVTVLARSAAEADAAATVVANAVDLPGHPAVVRVPADSIAPDSDLGSRLVTRDVGALTGAEIAQALAAGLARAEDLLARGLILGAALQLQGQIATTAGRLPSPLWRGVGGEGAAGRAQPSSRTRQPQAQQPSPPAPLHKGEGSGALAHWPRSLPESLHA